MACQPKGGALPHISSGEGERPDFPALGNRIIMLSGRMGAMIGGEVLEAGPGELVVKPRGVPHAFWSATDDETRVLEVISPGGFEQYFADLAPLLSAGGEPDIEALGAV